MKFDPRIVPATGKFDARLFRCPRGKCGVMFDVTPRLAEALVVRHYRCDRCGDSHAVKFSGQEDS